MTDTFARDARAGDRAGMSRRQLLRAGAWAAPVLVLATAVPAAAASDTDQNQFPAPTTTGTIPGDRLTGRLALWNENSGGTPGPIGWNGQIGYWTNVQASDPTTGTLPTCSPCRHPDRRSGRRWYSARRP